MKYVLLVLFSIRALETPDRFDQCSGAETQVKQCENNPCKEAVCIDCEWGPWSDYGPCSCFGLKDRFRVIKKAANKCGVPCDGPKVTTVECIPNCVKENTQRDCILSEWTVWGECTKSCGGGQRYRERMVKQNLRNGGLPCEDELKQTEECHHHGCDNPQSCVVGPWSPWTTCSKSCGGGQTERDRKIITPARDHGELCSASLVEIAGCSKTACNRQVDCKWDEWVTWSACSVTCGGGERSRSRLIVVAPRNGGQLCSPNDMSQVGACETQSCQGSVNCILGDWTEWSACTCDCNGTRQRTRHITQYPEQGGTPCTGALKSIASCNTGPESCTIGGHGAETLSPVDCELGVFSAWTECTKTCGGGQQERSRSVTVEGRNGGTPCEGVLASVRPCGTTPCPALNVDGGVEAPAQPAVDCVWENWSSWNECSVSCGGGFRQRARGIRVAANAFGHPCPQRSALDVEGCNTHSCNSVDCVWAPWREWGACTCTGLRERHRSIKRHNYNGGESCDGAKVVTESCHPECEQPPVNCVLSPWGAWSSCSADCGGGEAYRTRHIAKAESHNGKPCEDSLKEVHPCNTNRCEHSIDCHISEWTRWTECTATCDGGQSFRHRRIITFSAYGGQSCTSNLKEIRGCGETSCGGNQDCKWGPWTSWSACTTTCGGGQKTRDRSVDVAPRQGGKLCNAVVKSEVAACNTEPCGHGHCINGRWGPWHAWGLCSASCGIGYQSRDRLVEQQSNYCGIGLQGDLTEYRECNKKPCSAAGVDCEFDDWSSWGACSCSCNGIRDRSRHIREYARNGGRTCAGAVKEVEPCNEGKCNVENPVDCKLGKWTPWDDCTAVCGGGIQTRYREVESPPLFGGKPCEDSLKEVQGCNLHDCKRALDCEWGEWEDWDTCSAECGGGQRTRYRHIKRMPAHGGNPCLARENVQIGGCNNHHCGEMMYCSWSHWGEWTSCSTTCGAGQATRRRHLVKSPIQPLEGVMDSGILAHLNQGLEDDMKKQFSTEDAYMVFLMSMVATSFSFAAMTHVYRRFRVAPRIASALD